MISIPSTTLCCIDCNNYELAWMALLRSQERCAFERVLFLTDKDIASGSGIEVTKIETIASRAEYSRFVIKDLHTHIETSHVLMIQWDGFVVNASAWQSTFLDYDYIGARWGWITDEMAVGNGGFSLRSRKLLAALRDNDVVMIDPEDVAIGRHYRPLLEERYGIRFAPPAVADAFSFETTYFQTMPFGFHGLFNMWMFIDPRELADFVANLASRNVSSPQFFQLGINYRDLGRRSEAKVVFERILEVEPENAKALAALRELEQGASSLVAAPNPTRNQPCPCGSGSKYKLCCGKL